MKAKTRVLVLICTALLGLCAQAFWYQFISRQSGDVLWIKALYDRKEAIAASIAEPKAVLIGGSSVHFGYDACLMSEQLGRKFLNFGTHAALGGGYLLDHAKRVLKRGDVAVLSLNTAFARVRLSTTF